jgi:CDP-paratose 2-epimerase
VTATTDPSDQRPVLVTGGAGFIGSNLADRLAADGHHVIVYDKLARRGVDRNLAWLQQRHGERIHRVIADIRDEERLTAAAQQAKAIFHLAAQVAVTTSLAQPREDFEVNILGTLNLLEAVRLARQPVPVIFASTNKVYGDLADVPLSLDGDRHLPADGELRSRGIDEQRPLDFHTPYGCSKGAADQYVLDYARSYGIPAAVMRMSCVYGRRQMGTEDQGWVAHFLIRALSGEPITIFGDGCQVRDILDVRDAVAAYLGLWKNIRTHSGEPFNLGGGPANAISLRELLSYIEQLLGRDLDVTYADWRAGDQRYFVADSSRLRAAVGASDGFIGWKDGVADLAAWLSEQGKGAATPPQRTAAPRLQGQAAL